MSNGSMATGSRTQDVYSTFTHQRKTFSDVCLFISYICDFYVIVLYKLNKVSLPIVLLLLLEMRHSAVLD